MTRPRRALARRTTAARALAATAALGLVSAACSFVRSFDGFDVGTDAGPNGAPPRTDGGGDGGAGTAALKCASDHRACEAIRACVLPTDPNFGCGNGDCRACDATNASAVACANVGDQVRCVATCRPGFEHCVGDAGGCDTNISKKANCGACGAACDGGTPYCSPLDAGGFGCVANCAAGLERCGDECVSTQDNVDNCGVCGKRCEPPAGAHAICTGGSCGSECNAGLHSRCGAECIADNDPHRCGSQCEDCAAKAPPNMVATCQTFAGTGFLTGICIYACAAGFSDCSPAPGCETQGDCPPSGGTEVSGGN